jgi:integrase
MNEATEQGLNKNLVFRSKKFTKPSSNSYQIYLNEKELSEIIKLDLSNESLLENARDLFIIGAYTGLRVSDFNNLSKENIESHKNQKILKVIVQKTNTSVSIPIHPIVEKIIARYDGNFPKRIADQTINNCLKIIGKKAKINDLITVTRIKGGKEVKETKPKHDMIVNHTARRSFCTNAYINNMPTLDIMAISGHSSEKTFLNYIKINEEERAIKIAGSEFFKPKTNLKIV